MSTKLLRLAMLGLASMLVSACGTTPPTNFYTLHPDIPVQIERSGDLDKIIIGIGPVEVSPYLERNQIVTRTGSTRLKLTDLDHWAAPLEDTIANVLAVNLSRLLPETQPIFRPWSDAETQYHVLIKMLQFDSDLAGNVQLKANWAIRNNHSQDIALIRYAVIDQPSLGDDYDSITQNLSSALALFSKEISLALTGLIDTAR